MKTKNVVVLLVSAIALVGVSVYVSKRNAFQEEASNDRLFNIDLSAADVFEVRKENNVVTISKDKNGFWGVNNRDFYEADHEMLGSTLKSLESAKIIDRKTSKPEFYDALQVGDKTGTKLIVQHGKDFLVEMIVGKRTYESSEPASFVRVKDNPQVLLVNGDFKTAHDAQDWLFKDVLNIEASRIESITYSNFSLKRAAQDKPDFKLSSVPAGRKAKAQSVLNDAATVLTDLKLKDVAKRGDVAFHSAPSAVFKTFDGVSLSFIPGKKGDVPFYKIAVSLDEKKLPKEGSDKIKAEVKAIEERTKNWAYQFISYKASKFEGNLETFLESKDDKKKSEAPMMGPAFKG